MRSFDKNEREIINHLKDLPSINPEMEKDALYARISQKVNSELRPRKKTFKLFPILGSAMAFILVISALPFLFDFSNETSEEKLSTADIIMNDDQDSNHQMKIMKDSDEDSGEDMSTKEPSDDSDSSEVANKEQNHSQGKINQVEDEKVIIDENLFAHTVNDLPEEEKLVYLALPDQQVQYVVPLTIAINQEVDINDVYNHLNDYLPEDALGLNDFPLDGGEFDVDLAAKKVNLTIPDEINFAGEAHLVMFDEILAAMFLPYGIETVLINNGEGAEFDQFGYINDIPLIRSASENYKIYQPESSQEQFIIPIPSEEMSIDEAFNDLKNSAEEFDVYASVPEEVNFKLIDEGQNLKVEFDNEVNSIDGGILLSMFESMLMTAKSYQFSTVEFNNTGIDMIHDYDLSNPVPVPKAINLIN